MKPEEFTSEANTTSVTVRSLGRIRIPERTFELDRSQGEDYCRFSAELLRLSLLGIAAIGFIGKDLHSGVPMSAWHTASCLIFLSLSSAGALAHRFFAYDGLACQLRALRLELRNAEGDKDDLRKENEVRKIRFAWSSRALVVSMIFLWLGAVSLGMLLLQAL